ncbi:hypothetical protein MTsPCn9_34310 [Croceitalea sp. MTPC9]|uniref:M23 family metallopeptidase n=1 Tax=unclassified Croceitalea TaxID=2632280 RepID=UPI002B366CC1|nr:hypothetical protein MTsPCn6_34640 [Croceitalea sp. MTPC6]GMN18491.1 hypothetical protein MTsPCn9_34310 [Croceitalea sp. MTPC9]
MNAENQKNGMMIYSNSYSLFLGSTLFFLFSVCFIQAQTNEKKEPSADLVKHVKLYLKEAADGNELALLFEMVKPDKAYFMVLFDSIPTIHPLNPKNEKRVSDGFGDRFHPIEKKNKPHLGIDITAETGTAIHAAADGTVTLANKSKDGYGNEVRITHSNGFSTRYTHMYTFIVKKGMKVKKGDIIGFVGSTGKSTGPHIHYEVRKHGKAVNPEYFLGIPI